jgi:hypothetical protein
MDNSQTLEQPADSGSPSYRLISKVLSHLAFEAPAVRLIAELSLCFVLFEVLAQFSSPSHGEENPAQWIGLWFGCCIFMATVDATLFVPAFRIFNLAVRYSANSKPELAIKTFDLLNPALGKLIHLPSKIYHVERAKLLADLDELELAKLEVTKIPANLESEITQLTAEIVALKDGFNALADLKLNEFTKATSLVERALSENKYGVERSYLKQAKEIFSKLKESGPERHLAELYYHTTNLWLGYAEDAFPELMNKLSPSGRTGGNDSAIGKLYLFRSLYAFSHRHEQLGLSDYRLGIILTRPYQVKQLKLKLREEMGELFHANFHRHSSDRHS